MNEVESVSVIVCEYAELELKLFDELCVELLDSCSSNAPAITPPTAEPIEPPITAPPAPPANKPTPDPTIPIIAPTPDAILLEVVEDERPSVYEKDELSEVDFVSVNPRLVPSE